MNKPGPKGKTCEELEQLVISLYKQKGITLEILPQNKEYFDLQNDTKPSHRYCKHLCPICKKIKETTYQGLKYGHASCKICGNKSGHIALSYTYQEMINKIQVVARELNIKFKLQDDNLEKYERQCDKSPSNRYCHYFCPGCQRSKQSLYVNLLKGVNYLCKSCSIRYTYPELIDKVKLTAQKLCIKKEMVRQKYQKRMLLKYVI